MILPPPNTEAEKRFEIKLLKEIKIQIDEDMPLLDILNVLERARHIVVEMMAEASVKQ